MALAPVTVREPVRRRRNCSWRLTTISAARSGSAGSVQAPCPTGRWRSAADCAVVASTAPRIAAPRCSSFPLWTPHAGRPARRARQHGHHIGRAGWRPPGGLPDAPPRPMMLTARSLAVSLEEARDPQGASAVGQDHAGARSRRAPAPPSAWVCRSTPCGRPAEPAAARRRDQPAAPAHRRHGRFRPLRSRARLARRCEAPGLYGGRRGIDTRGGRATRAALEAGAIIGLAMARPPASSASSVPKPAPHVRFATSLCPRLRRRLIPRPQLPNARPAVRQLTDMQRQHLREQPVLGRCAAFRAETSPFA
jgi:hypothetical protein